MHEKLSYFCLKQKISVLRNRYPAPCMKKAASLKADSEGLHHFRIIKEIGSGTYGCVYEATDIRSGARVALKRVLPKSEKEGFPVTAIREIKTLRHLHHLNIVELLDVIFQRSTRPGDDRDSVYMVFPCMDHDLVGLQHFRNHRMELSEVKCVALQILRGLEYLHSNHIVHRDLKLANLLISSEGIVKIGDFGLARLQPSHRPNFTNKVVTRWYRPPELLLGETIYDSSVDMWSFSTILAELVSGFPLFPGESEVHVLRLIMDTIGPPNDNLWPQLRTKPEFIRMLTEVRDSREQLHYFIKHPLGICRYDSGTERPVGLIVKDMMENYANKRVLRRIFQRLSEAGLILLSELLQYDPQMRICASQVIHHSFFAEEPRPCRPSEIALAPEPVREREVKEGISIRTNRSNKRPPGRNTIIPSAQSASKRSKCA